MLVSRSPTAATVGARKIVLAKPNQGIPTRNVKSAIKEEACLFITIFEFVTEGG